MYRRQFLSWIAVAASAPLVTQCNRREIINRVTSQDGLLELSLTAQAESQTLAGKRSRVLAYNGQIPGPLLEARAGDTVHLTLTNQLDTPTNLHYHGLHLSPEIDDVFREVAPGESYTYEFSIPSNHPAITAWYHPHYHLDVARQVFGGLAGPFIIRGDLDEIPELQQADEALLVLQDFEPTFQLAEPHSLGKKWGREGSLLLANGQHNPVISMRQNGLLRLRLINTSASRIYQLQLPNHPWFLIATDRGAISEPTQLDILRLSPGERAELLISGQQTPGDYRLISLPYDRGINDMVTSLGTAVEQMSGVVEPVETTLATLRYQPGTYPEPLPFPQELIPVEPLPAPDHTREFVLNHGVGGGVSGFIINGKSFDMNRVDTQVKLNDVEDWRIVNQASIDHPFHLHTNRFQVIERNGQPEPFLSWKDTVSIKGYETVTIRVRFEDFIGRTVYHCHILDHEDQGMMGILEIS
ncbi:MAG: multicopper oxidase family protein [Cyanobacteria bacterium P01_D01_bin.156]